MIGLDRYNAVSNLMETGDLLLWRGDTPLGKAIRLFSHAQVNHASLVMRFQQYEGAERRRFTSEALEHGIVLHLLSKSLADYNGQCWWYPLKIDVGTPLRKTPLRGQANDDRSVPTTLLGREEVGERALKYMGTPYDYEALFKNAIEKVKADPQRLFCSEYCFLCYGMEGLAPTPGEMPALGIFDDPILIWDSRESK